MKYFIVGLLIITTYSCSKEPNNNILEKAFIISHVELNNKCKEALKEIIKPYEIEIDSFEIDKALMLDINFDSTFYSKEDLEYNYFFGIMLKPEYYDLIIFNIDLRLGAITTCEMLSDEKLIINNMGYLFTNLKQLGECKEFNIPDSLVAFTSNNKTMFRQKGWTNTMYGKWKPKIYAQYSFKDKRFNSIWKFSPEKLMLLENENQDTLFSDTFDLQGEYLQLIESKFEFEIATQTKSKILIRDLGTDNFITLTRIK